MGTSTSAAQLSAKLNRLAAEVKDTRKPLVAAAMAAKLAFVAANPDVVGHRVPRKSRGKIGVRYDIRGNTAIVRYTGPAHLVLNPTAPHEILPRGLPGAKRRRRSGARALTIDGNLARRAHHPGTRGKDPGARRAKAAAAKAAPKAYHRAGVVDPLRRVFGHG
jgi:hypothetical protein